MHVTVGTEGYVRIGSTGPARPLLVDRRVRSAPEDLDALIAAVELYRDIGAEAAPRDGWGTRELYPASMAATPVLARGDVLEPS